MPIERSRSSVIATAAGLLVVALAALGLAQGRLAGLSMIRPVADHFASSADVSLSFLLIGVALLGPAGRPEWQRRLQIAAGALALVISAVAMYTDLADVSSGISRFILQHWLPGSGFTGRMAPDGAAAFIACGLAMILMHFGRSKWAGVATQILTFLVLAIGVTEVFVHVLNLDLLYGWYRQVRVSTLTAAGFILLGIALAASWVRMDWAPSLYREHEDEKISLVGGAILMAIAIATGVGTFAILQHKMETTLAHELALTLENRAGFFTQIIDQSESDARFIATRPILLGQLERLETDPGDRHAKAQLQTAARSFVEFGYNAVAIYDRRHRRIVHAGAFAASAQADVRLSAPYATRLLWHKGVLFRTYLPMKSGGREIGFVDLERPLPYLAKMFQAFRGLGATSDMAVCAARGNRMLCFPVRDVPHPAIYPRVLNEESLPMSHALDGHAGVITAKDYRQQNVIAAYGPIGDLGLGMVLKIDTAELYDPIRRPLEYAVPLLLLLIVLGTFLLRWQVTPLVRRLIRSERESRGMRRALEHVVDGVSRIDSQGHYLSVNGGYAGALGYAVTDLVGKEYSVIVHPDDRESIRKCYEQMQRDGRAELEVRAIHKNGAQLHIHIFMASNYDQNRDLVGQYCFMKDISERKRVEKALHSMSFIDDLTGLQNRRGFLELAGEQLKLARRSNRELLLFFLDVDGMKQINDEFGHREGDAALIRIAQVLRSTFRDSDVVGRLGGDEFAVITVDTGVDAESAISERLRANLDECNSASGAVYHLDVSVGSVRSDPASDASLAELMVQADRLMYRNKHAKPGRLKLK